MALSRNRLGALRTLTMGWASIECVFGVPNGSRAPPPGYNCALCTASPRC
jgi:hypothetical protein